jgi:hypothetical protein
VETAPLLEAFGNCKARGARGAASSAPRHDPRLSWRAPLPSRSDGPQPQLEPLRQAGRAAAERRGHARLLGGRDLPAREVAYARQPALQPRAIGRAPPHHLAPLFGAPRTEHGGRAPQLLLPSFGPPLRRASFEPRAAAGVVSHAADERNYHIFYQLLVGASALQRRELGFSEVSTSLRYLRGGVQSVRGLDDAAGYESTLAALRAVGCAAPPLPGQQGRAAPPPGHSRARTPTACGCRLTSEELKAVLSALAGLLHLGNLVRRRAASNRRRPRRPQRRSGGSLPSGPGAAAHLLSGPRASCWRRTSAGSTRRSSRPTRASGGGVSCSGATWRTSGWRRRRAGSRWAASGSRSS